MTLVIIMLVSVNVLIWVGIKRGIAHAVKPHDCPCASKAPESQPKPLTGVPWTD